jgi:DNA anti-recombination protein RmuC
MEMSLIKMIASLMAGMSATESFSLIVIVLGALYIGATKALGFVEFIKKTSGQSNGQDSSKQQAATNITVNNEQVLIQLSLIRDKLNALELKLQQADSQKFEMPKELANELAHLFKVIEDSHNEHASSHKDILKMIATLEDGLAIVKEKISHIEQILPSLKSDSKDDIKEVNQNVQAVAKDIATLQGTLLGNLNSRSGR